MMTLAVSDSSTCLVYKNGIVKCFGTVPLCQNSQEFLIELDSPTFQLSPGILAQDNEVASCVPCSGLCFGANNVLGYILSPCNATQDRQCADCPDGMQCDGVTAVITDDTVTTSMSDLLTSTTVPPTTTFPLTTTTGFLVTTTPQPTTPQPTTPAPTMPETTISSDICCNGKYGDFTVAGCETCPENHYCPCEMNSEGGGIQDLYEPYECANGHSVAGSRSKTDCECNENTYQVAPGNCQYCPDGTTFVAESGKIPSIDSCRCTLAGSFLQLGTGDIFACVACPENHWCADGIKHTCPLGSSGDSVGALSVFACDCGPGTYLHVPGGTGDPQCLACRKNFYCPSGSTSETMCPVNTHTLTMNAADQSACICDDGLFHLGGDTDEEYCTECPPNTYCQGGVQYTCPADSSTLGNARSKTEDACTCTNGYFRQQMDGVTICTECSQGKYCTLGSNVESACFDDATTRYAGASSVDECKCDVGMYRQHTGLHFTCVECPQHSTTEAVGATRFNQCICNAGYHWDSEACMECTEGTYCPENALNRPFLCDDTGTKYLTSPPKSVSQSDCTCQKGFYWDSSDNADCIPCESGYFCPGGDEIPQTCSDSNARVLYANAGIEKTACKCVAGFYNADQDASDVMNCMPCPTDSYCLGTGSGAGVTKCPENSISLPPRKSSSDCVCRVGTWYNFFGVCEICPLNFYCVEDSRFECVNRTITLSTGAESEDDCVCVNNEPKESNGWCPQQTDGAPTECGANAVQANGVDLVSQCHCVGGYYGEANLGNDCTLCPANFYCPQRSIVSIRCATGTFSNEGATVCEVPTTLKGQFQAQYITAQGFAEKLLGISQAAAEARILKGFAIATKVISSCLLLV
eukprot:2134728-Rhodomonas_salina.1